MSRESLTRCLGLFEKGRDEKFVANVVLFGITAIQYLSCLYAFLSFVEKQYFEGSPLHL